MAHISVHLGRYLRTRLAFAGGMVAYWLARSPTMRRALTRWLGHSPRASPRPRAIRSHPLMELRQVILGHSKQAVLSAFGPPRIAQFLHDQFQDTAAGSLQSDTWYYPLRRRFRTAMAITFTQGRAADVQFIHVPP